ncbi:MAG: hypothetical protein IT426_02605 [Pirellulales bacterium]|nr:hypothetical protein [Pirellulales bacterium]
MFSLVIIHILGVTVAVILALIEIESIIPTGICLVAYSLIVALLAYRRNRATCLYYALAAPSVSVACFSVIFGLHWGPNDARIPIGCSLALFGLVNIPFGIAALFELKQPESGSRRKGPFQYSIASIMGLTLVVALSLSLSKTLGNRGIALAILLCHLSLTAYILRRFHKKEWPATGN